MLSAVIHAVGADAVQQVTALGAPISERCISIRIHRHGRQVFRHKGREGFRRRAVLDHIPPDRGLGHDQRTQRVAPAPRVGKSRCVCRVAEGDIVGPRPISTNPAIAQSVPEQVTLLN